MAASSARLTSGDQALHIGTTILPSQDRSRSGRFRLAANPENLTRRRLEASGGIPHLGFPEPLKEPKFRDLGVAANLCDINANVLKTAEARRRDPMSRLNRTASPKQGRCSGPPTTRVASGGAYRLLLQLAFGSGHPRSASRSRGKAPTKSFPARRGARGFRSYAPPSRTYVRI